MNSRLKQLRKTLKLTQQEKEILNGELYKKVSK